MQRMEFWLLGPLLVRRFGVAVPVSQGKQRILLATLLLNANRVVPLDELAEVMWGPKPPSSARVTMRNYVKRLRLAIGDADRSRISTEPRGYLMCTDSGELDVTRFEELAGSACTAAREGSWGRVSADASAALALWRGDPLADVESDALAAREVPRLAEIRLQVVEARLEAELYLGGHSEVIPDLQRLTNDHPLREHLHGLLMLALYRVGRQAEALAVYREARRVLIDELGTEPGTRLRELHQQILTGDPVLAVTASELPVSLDFVPAVPRELPASVPHFVGRKKELAALTGLLQQTDEHSPGTMVITALGGTAGVGKTALALCWSHQVAPIFSDGQLYVNLRGYDPDQPISAADALAGFLRSLGLPGQHVPASTDERAALYRSMLAGRRMLLLLDNASSVEQVRPLLPGTSGCVVVVTSRDSLAGLVARDGAQRLVVNLLPQADAITLLRALIGARVDAEPAAAQELARHCARLPLALRVAAELAVSRPADPLANLVIEVADQPLLDLLDARGDDSTKVRAVFSSSYRHLDANTARAFRLAGLHPGPDLDRYALAALADITVAQATQTIDLLARSYLVHQTAGARCGMHDLLAAYARELAEVNDADEGRNAALTRLFDQYLYTASIAVNLLHPAGAVRRPRIPLPSAPAPHVADPAAALTWLDAERANLVAVTTFMAANGWPGHATRMSATLSRYLEDGGHFSEAISVHTHAGDAARRVDDRAAEANTLSCLGLVAWWQSRYGEAADLLRQAVSLSREIDDLNGQALALANLGIVEGQQGRYEQAADYLRQALAMVREIGDRVGETSSLVNLGTIDDQQGRYEQATDYYLQALTLSRETGDQNSQAYVLGSLGAMEGRRRRFELATSYIQQSLSLFRTVGNRSGQCPALAELGHVELQQRHFARAADCFRESLALCRELGDRSGEAVALNGLGEALLGNEQFAEARGLYASALRLAAEVGQKKEQARAHDGLAAAHHAAGDNVQARHHFLRAFNLYQDLGAEANAERVRAVLASLAETPR
jgi:DNA-binding SARP family transcriptional activator/tetratricopeptide (TPR) repeat protein